MHVDDGVQQSCKCNCISARRTTERFLCQSDEQEHDLTEILKEFKQNLDSEEEGLTAEDTGDSFLPCLLSIAFSNL
jgi:hypothetical protein